MTDSPSSSESDIEVVSSQKSVPVAYESVPETQEFKFRIFGTQCSKNGSKLSFHLKEGKSLPYLTITETKKGRGIVIIRYSDPTLTIYYSVFGINFSKTLTPSLTGFTGVLDGDWWVFREG